MHSTEEVNRMIVEHNRECGQMRDALATMQDERDTLLKASRQQLLDKTALLEQSRASNDELMVRYRKLEEVLENTKSALDGANQNERELTDEYNKLKRNYDDETKVSAGLINANNALEKRYEARIKATGVIQAKQLADQMTETKAARERAVRAETALVICESKRNNSPWIAAIAGVASIVIIVMTFIALDKHANPASCYHLTTPKG